jgi:enoyl-CoA hydratase/carnithine racemase
MGVVRYEVSDRVGTITIDRAERRNALNTDVLAELRANLARARDDDDVHVIVLTGAGDRAFSAGGDLAPGKSLGGGPLKMHWDRAEFVETLLDFRRVHKPIVGRINGDALGGGFGLLLACDIVIAREDARLGCPEINVGLFPMMIMALIFRNVPQKLGMEMILTGRKIRAHEAVPYGFLNAVVPVEELDATVSEMCQQLASKSPAVLKLGLEAYYTMADMDLEHALRYLQGCLTVNTLSADAAEGIMAFLQKREPNWKGR